MYNDATASNERALSGNLKTKMRTQLPRLKGLRVKMLRTVEWYLEIYGQCAP